MGDVTPITQSPLVKPPQVAEYLGITEGSVKALARAGTIPAIKVGRLWRFRMEDIENWAREQARKSPTDKKAS